MLLLLQVQWVEERRWPLIGTKANELHSGYGIVTIIRWRDNYLAWANEKVCVCVCVCVYQLFSLDPQRVCLCTILLSSTL